MKPEIIELPQCSISKKEVLVEDLGQAVYFFPEYIILKSSGKWKIQDETLEMLVQKEFWNQLMVEKNSCLGLEMYIHAESGAYIIQLQNFRLGTNDMDKVNKLWDKIMKWKFSENK